MGSFQRCPSWRDVDGLSWCLGVVDRAGKDIEMGMEYSKHLRALLAFGWDWVRSTHNKRLLFLLLRNITVWHLYMIPSYLPLQDHEQDRVASTELRAVPRCILEA